MCIYVKLEDSELVSVDGRWSPWSSWEKCTVTCGDGKQRKTRVCSSPAPAYGGKNCSGFSVRLKTCNTQSCSTGKRDVNPAP